MLIAFPNADDPSSGNHESLESKIPKRKKARPNTRLSCKIEYFIETTSAYPSGRSAFFTDDDGAKAYTGVHLQVADREAGWHHPLAARSTSLPA
ncbi:hypothetical protein JEY40_07860 [Bradyrhizobium japonicum]|uniref:hypothetical protein n=1 Tax=Bradyrhizobium TaxID=374 RepID=UPI0012FD3E25|nr:MULTISPECIES: hypothetical protein [Bradyrhizobium]UQD74448.1 hypothetical protein JEY40_07860 [Bradyrhizobium japonicum]